MADGNNTPLPFNNSDAKELSPQTPPSTDAQNTQAPPTTQTETTGEITAEGSSLGENAEVDNSSGMPREKIQRTQSKSPQERVDRSARPSSPGAARTRSPLPPQEYPTTLDGFNYNFNKDGKMRHTETGSPFEFDVYKTHKDNQRRYEALGKVIDEHVFTLLEEVGLKRHYVPVDAKEDEPRSFVFMSEDALTNPEKLMLLIHGAGVVRAGQWARRLIMNDGLDSGTQLPYIRRAMDQKYGVIVLNTNYNRAPDKHGNDKTIQGNSNPEKHGQYVWDTFVHPAKALNIAIVAHSYGGVVTEALAVKNIEEFEKRVFAVAFTDSVHDNSFRAWQRPQKAAQRLCDFFNERAQNWVSSDEPVDTPQKAFGEGCKCVSAGHPKHENTSWSAFESVFKYFTTRCSKRSTKRELYEVD